MLLFENYLYFCAVIFSDVVNGLHMVRDGGKNCKIEKS